MASATQEETCYRHPDRETAVSCSSCGRPICMDCMTPTPVGMRCPECTKDRVKVRSLNSVSGGTAQVTLGLIILNVVLFVASGQFGVSSTSNTQIFTNFALDGPDIHVGHDYWRLITGGFLHAGIVHIGFNMYLLYILGQMLEPAMGSRRFGAIYFVSLLAGSFGALAAQPDSYTVGASGAIFGLLGYTFFELRSRGIDPFQTGIGTLIVLNLAISFLPGLNISVGGHIGGLVGGSLCALAVAAIERRRLPAWAPYVAFAIVGVVSVVGALYVAGDTSGLGI